MRNVKKIKKAKEDALLAFWASVAESFPEVKSGDFPIGYDDSFNVLAEEMIFEWLQCNQGRVPHPMSVFNPGSLCRIPEEHDPSCRCAEVSPTLGIRDPEPARDPECAYCRASLVHDYTEHTAALERYGG